MRRWVSLVLAAALAIGMAGCGKKEEVFPGKPIDLIIPWSAGGGTDVAGRLYAKFAEKQFGQTINVLNVPGGNGAVGAVQARDSKEDGYTQIVLQFDILSSEILGLADVGYKDFRLVNTFSIQPTVLVVNASSGWSDLEDYIQAAKANPGALKIGTNGDGSVWHQAGAIADSKMGTEVTYVPYNGSGEQTAALLGAHVDGIYVSYNAVKDHLEEGTLIAMGVMTEERVPNISDTPTFKEQGFDAVYNSWRGIAAPKDTPDDVFLEICNAYQAAYNDPDFKEAAVQGGIDLWFLEAAEFEQYLADTYGMAENTLTELGMVK